jgi:hypothetical protein
VNQRRARLLTVLALALGAIAPIGWYAFAAWCQRDAARALAAVHGELEQARHRAIELAAAPAPGAEPAALRWHLASAPEVAAILHELQLLGQAPGIAFDSVMAVHPATPGRQAFEITGTGTVAALCAALAAIETHPRLLVIEALNASADGRAEVRFAVRLAHHYRTPGAG